MFLYELYIFSAVFRKILIFFDSTDIAFPSRKLLNNRFCFLKLHSCREFCCYLSVDLIACANRDLIQISQNIQYCKSNVCSSLETASVFGCNTVEPSHTSRTACSSTELTTVTATFSQLICFLAEDLRNECTCSNCTGVSFAYGYDLLDLIWRQACTDGTISSQCGRGCNHRIDSVIRVFQSSELSLKKNLFALFQCIPEIERYVTYVWLNHFLVFHQLVHDIFRFQKRFVIEMLKCYVFGLTDTYNFLFQCFLIKELTYLEADLCIFVRIERSDSGFCGTESLAAKTLLFILIEQNVVRHYHLCSVGDQDLRCRYSTAYYFVVLLEEYRNIQCNTVSDDTCCMSVKHT